MCQQAVFFHSSVQGKARTGNVGILETMACISIMSCRLILCLCFQLNNNNMCELAAGQQVDT